MILKFGFLFLAFASLMSNVSLALAEAVPPFAATCMARQVMAYRYTTDLNGKIITDEWSECEKIFSEWRFLYAGGNEVIVDGQRLSIVAKKGPCLIVASPGESPLGAGIWVYAINVKLRSIVAAQVNAHIGIAYGLKTRSVCFNCDFVIHE